MRSILRVCLSLLATTLTVAWAETPYEEAVAAFRGGDYERAASKFEEILAERPEWAPGHVALGQCLYLLGQAERGEESLRRAAEVESETDLFRAYMEVAQLLYRDERYAEAIAPLESAVALADDARHQTALRRLAFSSYSAGDYVRARRMFEEHERRYGVEPDPTYYLALSCQRVGDYPCALDALRRAEAAGAERPRLREYLAEWSRYWALLPENRDRRDELLALAVEANRRRYLAAPADAEALEAHAATLLAADRAAELIDELAPRAGIDPSDCRLPTWIARACNVLGRTEEAESWVDRALECDPDSSEAHLERAAARVQRLRPEHSSLDEVQRDLELARSALAPLERVLELRPEGHARAKRLQADVGETIRRLEQSGQAFTDRDRELNLALEEEIRQRCVGVLWKMDHNGDVTTEDEEYYRRHDCRRYRR